MRSIEWCNFLWPWVPPNLDFKVTNFSTSNNLKMVQYSAISQWQTDRKLCMIYRCHLWWPLTHISSARHYLMLNISETIKIEIPGNLTKDNSARRPWVTFEDHFRYYNGFVGCISNIEHIMYKVNNNNARMSFLLSYSTGMTVVWCWARPVSDS